MKKFLGILLCLFGVFVMSHNAGAVGRIGFYSGYETNSNISGGLNLNTRYTFGWTNRTSVYLRKGRFSNSFDWYEGNIYHLVITLNFYGDSFNVAGNEALRFESDYYTTENDEVSSTFSCSTECRYTIIHNITLRAIADGNYWLAIPESNLVSLFGINLTDDVQMMWTGTLFYDDDEWAAVKDDITGIHSDTTDIVDTLGEINDKLDALDSNADANAQAWDNMQDTDGLVDIGDDSQALSIVGTLNSVLGQVRDIPASVGCTINANFVGRINLGDLNLCTGKDTLGGVVSFSATVIFLFISFFIVLRIIKKVIRVISWCRSN